MYLFTKPKPKQEEDRNRDVKNEEVQAVVNDFLADMRKTLRELQETSHPDRKDFPISSALRRSTK